MSQKRKSSTKAGKRRLPTLLVIALLTTLVFTILQIRNAQDIRQKAQTAAPQPFGQTGGGWDLVFDEEFNGTSIDTNKWSFTSSAESTCTGDGRSLDSGCSNPANQQLEFNWGRNCTVANGILTITAKKESAGGRQWTSCMLHSRPKFQTMYMEARVKMPSVAGFWPGFWTWEGPSNEVDVFEYYTESNLLTMTNHAGSGGCKAMNFNPTDGYHVYAADIYPGGVRWYIDGKEQCTAQGSPKAPVSILLDFFVHDRQTQAANMAILETDYIRAWQKGATVPTVAPQNPGNAAPTIGTTSTPINDTTGVPTPPNPTPTFTAIGDCTTNGNCPPTEVLKQTNPDLNPTIDIPEPSTPSVIPSKISIPDLGNGQLPAGGGTQNFIQLLINFITQFFKSIFG